MKLLIKGNTKMGKEVYGFNLPVAPTCTPTHWCLHGRDGKPACFALRRNFLFESVKKSLVWRFEQSQRDDFASRMIDEIMSHIRLRFFRIHSSGDFYSAEYVEKWQTICRKCPHVRFRTSTRRRDLAEPLRKLDTIGNCVVRESLDVDRPEPQMGLRSFAAIEGLPIVDDQSQRVFHCPGKCDTCGPTGYTCWRAPINLDWELR